VSLSRQPRQRSYAPLQEFRRSTRQCPSRKSVSEASRKVAVRRAYRGCVRNVTACSPNRQHKGRFAGALAEPLTDSNRRPLSLPWRWSCRSVRIDLRLQASCKHLASAGDVTAFRLTARPRPKTGSEPAFRRNKAEHVYSFEAAHNPQVAGSNPAPATSEARHKRASCVGSIAASTRVRTRAGCQGLGARTFKDGSGGGRARTLHLTRSRSVAESPDHRARRRSAARWT
jgi:hypothetical protein